MFYCRLIVLICVFFFVFIEKQKKIMSPPAAKTNAKVYNALKEAKVDFDLELIKKVLLLDETITANEITEKEKNYFLRKIAAIPMLADLKAHVEKLPIVIEVEPQMKRPKVTKSKKNIKKTKFSNQKKITNPERHLEWKKNTDYWIPFESDGKKGFVIRCYCHELACPTQSQFSFEQQYVCVASQKKCNFNLGETAANLLLNYMKDVDIRALPRPRCSCPVKNNVEANRVIISGSGAQTKEENQKLWYKCPNCRLSFPFTDPTVAEKVVELAKEYMKSLTADEELGDSEEEEEDDVSELSDDDEISDEEVAKIMEKISKSEKSKKKNVR